MTRPSYHHALFRLSILDTLCSVLVGGCVVMQVCWWKLRQHWIKLNSYKHWRPSYSFGRPDWRAWNTPFWTHNFLFEHINLEHLKTMAARTGSPKNTLVTPLVLAVIFEHQILVTRGQGLNKDFLSENS